ncbi:MAG: class I SAM-dependent methyltransferase [Deltaproteobacteria bacterium]|nr:class I SAM-dependent methyltransferase [Deltaproteobacteria bacterium]
MSGEAKVRTKLYDGGVYGALLEPLLEGLHTFVAAQVEPGQVLLDVGCGTGALLRKLAPAARSVEGVDLSPAMIAHARKRAEAAGLENVSFRTGDATRTLSELPADHFDQATLVLALHEMPAKVRAPLLQEVARVSRSILCVDFRVPMPRNLPGLRNRTFELLAGLDHFRAFRDFYRRGGVEAIARAAELRYEHLRFVDGATLELARLSRPTPGSETA